MARIVTNPEVLVMSGAGVYGANMLGSLCYLHDKGFLERIHTYVGTSMGGFLGYLLAIGCSPIEMVVFFQRNKVLKSLNQFNIISMINGTGATSFSVIHTHFEKITVDKIGRFVTLGELKEKFGKTLIVATYNLTKNDVEYIGPDTHPTLPCLTALRMTANLPLIFEDFKYTGNYYIDGGIVDNFPIDVTGDNTNVLGIYMDPSTHFERKNGETNIVEYIFHLIFVPIKKMMDQNVQKAIDKGFSIIKLTKKTNTQFSDFSLVTKEVLDMFSDGYNDTKTFLEN